MPEPNREKCMFKIFAIFCLFTLSAVASADECARNVKELQEMLESNHNEFSTRWVENKNNPLNLRISNGNNALTMRFSKANGDWATVTATVCQNGDRYTARITNTIWGEAAPGLVKGKSIREIPLRFNGAVLKVKISLWSGEFRAL